MQEYRFDELISDMTISLESLQKKEDIELSLTDIFFVKSAGNYVEVWYRNGRVIQHRLFKSRLSALEEKLAQTTLVRCHRKFLVNLQHARKMRRSNHTLKIESHGTMLVVPVSKTYKEKVNLALICKE